MAKVKTKNEENQQQPGPKKRLSMSLRVPDARLPHDDLIRPLEQNKVSSIESGRLNEILRHNETSSLNTKSNLALTDLSLDETLRLNNLTIQSDQSINVMASLPDVSGYGKLWHQITDYLLPQLDPAEQAVFIQLYRLTWGWGENPRPNCKISLPRLASRSGMSVPPAHRAVKRLEQKGIVRKGAATLGKGKVQGIEYWVTPPPIVIKSLSHKQSLRLNESSYMKENTQKEVTQTQPSVSATSQFTLEECRRYAEHLKATGKGITNPGGYATKIFRSGEADALIETFLKPPTQIDISQCPDCRGTNFIYIDTSNHDKGVRPCKHSNLKAG
jgi:DNA-binding Lrp family transcriptional regulator